MPKPFLSRLYLVVSAEACLGRDVVEVAEQAVKGGVDLVQLREKQLDADDFIDSAIRLRKMLDKHSVPLIINDNFQVALQSKAYGIHVGNNDMLPSLVKKRWENCGLLGYSVEYIEQLSNPEINYADYVGISPVFSTPTKMDTVTEWGLEGIRTIRNLTDKPLVAIGNMNINNAFNVITAGADCLAVVSAICGADNPAKAAWAIRNEIEKAL